MTMDRENDKRLLRKGKERIKYIFYNFFFWMSKKKNIYIYILSCVCRVQENHLRNQKGEGNGRQLCEVVVA
jgi:hypothetical protein